MQEWSSLAVQQRLHDIATAVKTTEATIRADIVDRDMRMQGFENLLMSLRQVHGIDVEMRQRIHAIGNAIEHQQRHQGIS